MSNRFYLKVALQNKIKKYAFSNTHQINLPLIHSSLNIQQSSKDSLFYYQIQSSPSEYVDTSNRFLKQTQIIHELAQLSIPPESTIKIRIFEKKMMSEEEKRRKQSESSLQIPTNIEKKRSKSMQFTLKVFDQTSKTQPFDLTDNFILSNEHSKYELSDTQTIANYLQTMHEDKIFSKSTQIHLQVSDSMIRQPTKMTHSVSCSINFQKINKLLKKFKRVSEQQKIQLQILKQSIASRQQYNQIKKLQIKQQLNDVLELFGINSRSN